MPNFDLKLSRLNWKHVQYTCSINNDGSKCFSAIWYNKRKINNKKIFDKKKTFFLLIKVKKCFSLKKIGLNFPRSVRYNNLTDYLRTVKLTGRSKIFFFLIVYKSF